MYLYIINAAENRNLLKIGIATDPASRLRGLSTASPYQLNIVHSWFCGFRASAIETDVHKKLIEYRIRENAEWFLLEPELAVALVDMHIAEDRRLFSTAHKFVDQSISVSLKSWRRKMDSYLTGDDAPRMISNSQVLEFATSNEIMISSKQVSSYINYKLENGSFSQIRKGLYCNNNASPTPTFAEAACRIRSGAVVSLHTVLGDLGVFNNSTSNVYSIVPAPEQGVQPNIASVQVEGATFHFNKIKQNILEAGDISDRLVPMLTYDRATPEAAIVHWIYLASSHTSSMHEPDTQCDMDQLDLERLERLAAAAGLQEQVFDWVERCRQRAHDDDEQTYWQPGM